MSKIVTPDLIKHIAKLSRIELDNKQVESFKDQFSDIIEYFDKLNELDTGNVDPMSHAVELNNVLAPDEQEESLSAKKALSNAPSSDDVFFKVPKVLGDST